MDAWVGDRIAEHGGRVTGTPVTYRARFWSVVRCYPTDNGLVWFKENNPGHGFEAGLVDTLAQLVPDDVIASLGVDRVRGWLLAPDHGATLTHGDVEDQPTRYAVVQALARLQCSLLGRVAHPGIITLAPSTAGDRVRSIANEWAALQPTHPLHLNAKLVKRAGQAADVLDRRTASISDGYLTIWCDWLGVDLQVLRRDLAATEALLGVHRLVSWLRLVPYADAIELRTRAEIPRRYLAQVLALAG
ncbi:hypothetical protein GCM10009804_69490 [Kribbella hippodromi]|uniref:Uncharacterized protein n=1 Tax=Kribbella hippodromi TaxID=434347 RepID=A0ABP4QD35_9ACTN